MSDKVYVHYGSKSFDKERFEPVKNHKQFIKPLGGFWASPVDTTYSWYKWVINHDWYDISPDDHFEFTLDRKAMILHIDNMTDIYEAIKYGLAKRRPTGVFEALFDFETVAKEYDAMEVLIGSDVDLYWALYGWNVDSLLIFNPDIIVPRRKR